GVPHLAIQEPHERAEGGLVNLGQVLGHGQMRNGECGMRNVTAALLFELALPFRIPRSAFHIRLTGGTVSLAPRAPLRARIPGHPPESSRSHAARPPARPVATPRAARAPAGRATGRSKPG